MIDIPRCGLVLVAHVLTTSPAVVQYAPWCSEGAESCTFYSFEQCMATRIGTDMCNANPRYTYGYVPPRKLKRIR